MSWDNFFFAFSGSSAAIIGVIFAFIISKLLNIISDHDNLRNETTQLIIERQEIINDINTIPFSWHDKELIEYDYQIEEKLNQSEIYNKTPEQIFEIIKSELNRPLYLKNENIDFIKDKINENIKEREERKHTTQAYVIGKIQDITIESIPALSFPKLPPYKDFWKDINDVETQYIKDYQKTGIQIYKFNNQKDKIDAKINDFKVIRNILFTFIPITILTVIYPLHFIPLPPDTLPTITLDFKNFLELWFSIKGILLSILFVSTVGSMCYFISLCKKHIKILTKIKETITNECTNIKDYCQYFPETD